MSAKAGAATPREVFERVLRMILDRQFDVYADVFSTDATFEIPFAPPGVPRRIQGREQIRAFFAAAQEQVQTVSRRWEFRNVVVHETADPEVIVTEFDVHGELPNTGEPYQFANLQVLTVREGELVHLRDYWNPLDRPELAALTEARA